MDVQDLIKTNADSVSVADPAEVAKSDAAKNEQAMTQTIEREEAEISGVKRHAEVCSLAGWHAFPANPPSMPRDPTAKTICFVRRRRVGERNARLALAVFKRTALNIPGVVGVSFSFCNFETGEPLADVEAYRVIPDTWLI